MEPEPEPEPTRLDRSLNWSQSPSSRLQRRLPGKRPVLEPLVLEHLLPRSWTIHWLKNTSAEVQIYLYIELHKASLLTGKDFFDDPKGPLLACIGKIKDVELHSAGNYGIDIDDLANIDKDFKNALPYVDTLAVPPALNGFYNTGAVDLISYGHLRVEIADPEVKTSHGGDINTLYADRVNLVVDKDMGLPHIFSFPSDKFVAPPPAFEFRSPKLQDCNMVAQSYKDVGFGPHAPLLDEPSLAKQSDSTDLHVGQMYLVVGLLIQGEHSVTPSLYEPVDDIKHAGDNGPMAVTHTNAEWLAMIETWRFRDLLRRASIKLMNAIDTAKGREAIQLLTPDEPARNWGKYLSDHIIEWDVQHKVSDQQAAARLDAITKFRAKVDDLGPTGFPRKFQDLFKVREHIAANNTTIMSEAYRIKDHMPDLVISFFTEFALLACAPELIAVSAPNVFNELWISMKAEKLPVMPKGHEVDKDDKVWLNTELCKTCIVEGNFNAPATKQAVADAMSAVRARKATVFIADALFGACSHTWDSKDAAWGTDDFNDVFAFARQDTPTTPVRR
eukprot:jgi/Tetstr1/441280/TSEL_029531.t1